MKWTEIPAGQVNRALQRLLVAFGDRADTIVERINTDETVPSSVATLCYKNGSEPSAPTPLVSHTKAREVMGKNFFGPEEAQKYFGVTLSKRQFGQIAEIPFSLKKLMECKDTHILVAYAPISIVAVRRNTAKVKLPHGYKLFSEHNWYDGTPEGNGVSAIGWYLVRKMPGSDLVGLHDLPDPRIGEIQEAAVMVYTIIGHFLATGERLLVKEFRLTRTRGWSGYTVTAA